MSAAEIMDPTNQAAHSAVAAAQLNAITIREQQKELRRLETALAISLSRTMRAERSATWLAAVMEWITLNSTSLAITIEGEAPITVYRCVDDPDKRTKSGRTRAAVLALFIASLSPFTLYDSLRRVCAACGDTDCPGCEGATTDLVLPLAVRNLMREARS